MYYLHESISALSKNRYLLRYLAAVIWIRSIKPTQLLQVINWGKIQKSVNAGHVKSFQRKQSPNGQEVEIVVSQVSAK